MTDDSEQLGIDEEYLAKLSRRGLIQAGAASVPIGLAGCMGQDDNGNGNGNENRSIPDERIDTRFVFPHLEAAGPIPQQSWNPYLPDSYPFGGMAFGKLTHVPFQLYSAAMDEEYLVLGDSWEMPDDTTVRLTFRDDITWWDGTPITTKSIEVQERIAEAIVEISGESGYDNPYVDDWTIVDEQTWELSLNEPYSENFVKHSLIQGDVRVKPSLFESQVEELEDLIEDGDQGAAEEALTEFLERNIGFDQAYGNGPFQYREHDDTRLILEVFDDYVYSDNIYFTEVMFQEFSDPEEAFIAGNSDCVKWLPTQEQLNRAPEVAWTDELRITNRGIHMNMGMFDLPSSDAPEGAYDPITKEPEGWLVRKAIAYALNPEQLAQAYHSQAEPFDQPQSNYPIASYQEDTGPISREWIDENLENYAPHQPEKAREMLEAAGLEWDDDAEEWLDWEGEPIEVISLTRSDPVEPQVIKQNLEDIGLNVTIEASESFASDRWEGQFEYIVDQGTGAGPSVYSSFPKTAWQAGMYHGPAGESTEVDWYIPMPIGNTDVTDPSEREAFNQAEAYDEYVITGNEERLKELLWSANQFLPTADYLNIAARASINAERWILEGPDGLIQSGVRDSRNGFFNALKHPEGTLAPPEDSDYHPTN